MGAPCFLDYNMLASRHKSSVWLHSVLLVTLKVVTCAILQETSQRYQWVTICTRI